MRHQQRWVRTQTFDSPSWVPLVFRVRSFRSLNLCWQVKRSSFLKPVEFQHQLRLCNAYPGTEAGRVERLGARGGVGSSGGALGAKFSIP